MWNPSDNVQDDIDLQAERMELEAEWFMEERECYEPSPYDGTYSED